MAINENDVAIIIDFVLLLNMKYYGVFQCFKEGM